MVNECVKEIQAPERKMDIIMHELQWRYRKLQRQGSKIQLSTWRTKTKMAGKQIQKQAGEQTTS
jgi:hypothetical protein